MGTDLIQLAAFRSDAGHGDQSEATLTTTPGDVLAFVNVIDTDGNPSQVALTPWEAQVIGPALTQWASDSGHLPAAT